MVAGGVGAAYAICYYSFLVADVLLYINNPFVPSLQVFILLLSEILNQVLGNNFYMGAKRCPTRRVWTYVNLVDLLSPSALAQRTDKAYT